MWFDHVYKTTKTEGKQCRFANIQVLGERWFVAFEMMMRTESLWSFSAGTFFFTTYDMWQCPTSAFVDWPIFPRHSYMACTNRVNPFTRSLKHFPLGLLIENGQNKVFLGRIFRMATVFYCLALLKCSYSYSLFDRFRAENWWFRENLSSVHTHTNKHNGWNGKDWYIRFERSSIFGMTLLFDAAHSPPRWLLILSGSEQCVVWQIYCEFPSRCHIPKRTTKVYVRGCIKDGDLFTRYSDVCWLILKKHQIFPSIFGDLVSCASLQFLGEQKQTMAGWWERLCS